MNLMAQILINVVIAFLAGSLLLGFHRKVMARVQLRPGPPIIQYLLHSLKFFFKETSFPKTAAMPFYVGITVILAAVWVTAVIVGPVAQGSLMIIFGVYAIHKIVEHNAGSSSGSPYGKLSCVRAVFSAAGELPLFAVIAIIFLLTGTMDISGIIAYQAANGPLVLQLPLAAIMFFTLIVTKSPYSPFAITKGKEIISGFRINRMVYFVMVILNNILWTDFRCWILDWNDCNLYNYWIYQCYNSYVKSKPFCNGSNIHCSYLYRWFNYHDYYLKLLKKLNL